MLIIFRTIKVQKDDVHKLSILQRQGQNHNSGEAGGGSEDVDHSAEPDNQEAAGGEHCQVRQDQCHDGGR